MGRAELSSLFYRFTQLVMSLRISGQNELEGFAIICQAVVFWGISRPTIPCRHLSACPRHPCLTPLDDTASFCPPPRFLRPTRPSCVFAQLLTWRPLVARRLPVSRQGLTSCCWRDWSSGVTGRLALINLLFAVSALRMIAN